MKFCNDRYYTLIWAIVVTMVTREFFHFGQLSQRKAIASGNVKTPMNFKILAAAIGFTLLSWATPGWAQQRREQQRDPILEPLPSSIEQLTEPSRIRQYQRLLQEQHPLLYLFLQLEPAQPDNLQQLAEEQIRQILQQPPSLQQRLFQQQVEGTLELDNL